MKISQKTFFVGIINTISSRTCFRKIAFDYKNRIVLPVDFDIKSFKIIRNAIIVNSKS